MSYQFSATKVAKFKFKNDADADLNLSLAGINGQETSADTIINGINGLLWIVGKEEDFEATDGIRTVDEHVIDAD